MTLPFFFGIHLSHLSVGLVGTCLCRSLLVGQRNNGCSPRRGAFFVLPLQKKLSDMEKIFITTEMRKVLNAEYGQANVSKALNYCSHSLLSREIRQRALNEFNGVYYKV